ncbi:[Fe-Fe] hydrogenase large subunit C-terminal domain-containing protein [Clostridium omnivorum]|uniref:Hydrogenase n=1 Tax=Clostridium omnivorum TaxID=1604902 RepID=A0ABQ5N733_9CLOT|nr:[Fe-Fe] hydrogenase large subunit C-terminal domain-containing protein [Clostridium sp. E14]GLC31068.1 hydrogenase [Clostridium sp. E14]
MELINFSKANCRSCYKCLRSCPVKAIRIKNDQARIVEDRCVACGQCLVVCPQNARHIKSDLDSIKYSIKSGKNTIAIVAPSFSGAFDMKDELQLVAALKKLGFKFVEEVALGAEIITDLYKNAAKKGELKNLITTSCPSVNYLVQIYYPELIKYMIPLDSPMLVNGKLIREKYGEDAFITFVGPCTAKKFESIDEENKGIIDAVLTFDELHKWLDDEQIDLSSLASDNFDESGSTPGRQFPVLGKLDIGNNTIYDPTVVDGIDSCIKLFDSMEKGEIEGLFIEALACRGGCIAGPAMPKDESDYFVRQKKVKSYIRKQSKNAKIALKPITSSLDFSKKFEDLSFEKETASDEEIVKVLKKMGKLDKSDELNCGVCGYNTCREKAQAVLDGMAEINMCIHYIRNKAESISNLVFESSPNAIFTLDEDLLVKDFNPSSERIFSTKLEDIKDKPICMLMDDSSFSKVKETKENVIANRIHFEDKDLVLLENIIYMEKQGMFLCILTDITTEEKNKAELALMKTKTLDAAQSVIEKQMRVAQEIASLLGETTAETKVILTKLKAIAVKEVSDTK